MSSIQSSEKKILTSSPDRGVRDLLRNLSELLKVEAKTPEEVESFGLQLEKTALEAARAGLIDSVVAGLSPELRERCVDQWGKFEVGVDEKFVAEAIAGRVKVPEEYRFAKLYQRLAGYEVGLAGLKAGDRVLHFGSGPMPGTDIWMNKLFGVKVVGVEIDPKRAEEAKQVLQSFGLFGSDAVGVVNASATSIDPSGFDLVIFSAMVLAEPTVDTLKNFYQSIGPGSNYPPRTLILREPYGIGKLYYPSIQGKVAYYGNEVANSGEKLTAEDSILSRLFTVKPSKRAEVGGAGWYGVTGLIEIPR